MSNSNVEQIPDIPIQSVLGKRKIDKEENNLKHEQMEQPNIDAAQELLDSINIKIQSKCPSLNLTIVKFGYKTAILCLNKGSECMSRLDINNFNDTYNILSETEPKYRGKKYNKLLTAVSIVIANSLDSTLTELFSSTSVKERKVILEQYNHTKKELQYYQIYNNNANEEKKYEYRLNLKENQKKANETIDSIITNLDCSDGRINSFVRSGGKMSKRKKVVKRKTVKRKVKQNKK